MRKEEQFAVDSNNYAHTMIPPELIALELASPQQHFVPITTRPSIKSRIAIVPPLTDIAMIVLIPISELMFSVCTDVH